MRVPKKGLSGWTGVDEEATGGAAVSEGFRISGEATVATGAGEGVAATGAGAGAAPPGTKLPAVGRKTNSLAATLNLVLGAAGATGFISEAAGAAAAALAALAAAAR